MSQVDYGKPWEAKDKKERSLFDCSRLVGVEWEYNTVTNQAKMNGWKDKWHGQIAHDGSCGYEAVTPPIAGDHMVNCLTDLSKAFKDGEAEIDDRCGIHVHVDASDIAWPDMYRLLKTYALVEPILYMLAGQHRSANRYCVPCGDQYLGALSKTDPKGEVISVAFNQGSAERAHQYMKGNPGKKDGNRYKGLNLCPWLVGRKIKAKDTTLEFRLHRNAPFKDVDRVINWTKTCAMLVDWSVKASDGDVKKLPKSGLRALCQVIAPECNDWIIERLKAWKTGTSFNNGIGRRISLREGKYCLKAKT